MIDGSRPRAAPLMVSGRTDRQLQRQAAGELGRFLDDDMETVRSRLESARRTAKTSAAQLQAEKVAMARRKLEVLKRFVDSVVATGDARKAAALAKEIARLVAQINGAVRALAAMGGGAAGSAVAAGAVAVPAVPAGASAESQPTPEAAAATPPAPPPATAPAPAPSQADGQDAGATQAESGQAVGRPTDPREAPADDEDPIDSIRRQAIKDARAALRLAHRLLERLSQVHSDDADDRQALRRAVSEGLGAVLQSELDILAIPSSPAGHVNLSV